MPTMEEWRKARESAKHVSLLTGKTHDMGWVYDLTEEEFIKYKANRRAWLKEKSMKKVFAIVLCVCVMAWFGLAFATSSGCGDGGGGSGGSGGAGAGGASAGGSSGGASSDGAGGSGFGGGAASDGSGGVGGPNDPGDRKARYFPKCDTFADFLAGRCR